MAVGVLLITHERIGAALLRSARAVFGTAPVAARAYSVPRDADTERSYERAVAIARRLNSGDGVLLLCDLYGSTPCNVAERVKQDVGGRLVAGVNLPMLLRVFNYPQLSLVELVEKAVEGGRSGVLS